jgi:hypothetical protein
VGRIIRSFPLTAGTDDGRALFAQHRDDHGPFTGPDVAFNVKDLLPGAEHGPAVAHGRRQARTEQRRLQMGMAVPSCQVCSWA